MEKTALFSKKNKIIKKINRLDSTIKVLSAEMQDVNTDHSILIKKKKRYTLLTSCKNNLAANLEKN